MTTYAFIVICLDSLTQLTSINEGKLGFFPLVSSIKPDHNNKSDHFPMQYGGTADVFHVRRYLCNGQQLDKCDYVDMVKEI